jgi:hypothetical protein
MHCSQVALLYMGKFMRKVLTASLLALSVSTLSEAQSDSVVYPGAAQFGVIPPDGWEESREFTGFINYNSSESIVISEVPVEGWSQLVEAFTDPALLQSQGIIATETETLAIDGLESIRIRGWQRIANGDDIPKCIILIRGTSAVGIVSAQAPFEDSRVFNACDLINSITERGEMSMSERLDALPYALTLASDYRYISSFAGSALTVTKGPASEMSSFNQPTLTIAISISPLDAVTSDQSDAGLDAYFSNLLTTIPSLQNFVVEESNWSMTGKNRMHRIFASAVTDSSPSANVSILQATKIRPDGNYLRMVGITRSSVWEEEEATILSMMNSVQMRNK